MGDWGLFTPVPQPKLRGSLTGQSRTAPACPWSDLSRRMVAVLCSRSVPDTWVYSRAGGRGHWAVKVLPPLGSWLRTTEPFGLQTLPIGSRGVAFLGSQG